MRIIEFNGIDGVEKIAIDADKITAVTPFEADHSKTAIWTMDGGYFVTTEGYKGVLHRLRIGA